MKIVQFKTIEKPQAESKIGLEKEIWVIIYLKQTKNNLSYFYNV